MLIFQRGLVKNKRPLCHGLGTFFPTVVEKKGKMAKRERMKRDWGSTRLVDKGRKGNPGWLPTRIA